tara:strand:+ start:54 stop:515 length:462 start_codon:yes stop_codon:yes gene_type:complete
MKKIKSINLFIIFFFIISCGYSPIYKDLKEINFSVNINELNGDRKINNLIKTQLDNYKNNDAIIKYDIIINTKYEKNIIAKNTTGAATEYKLIIYTSFKINSENINREFTFRESFNMRSINDKLEEQDYEENIKSNLVDVITRKFILKLSQIK